MSLKQLEGFDIEIINIDKERGKDWGITSVPTFKQGRKEHIGFANKEILESKGFVLSPKSV